MSLEYAKYRLTEWGNWSKDRNGGYPKNWAVSGFGRVSSCDPLMAMPDHIAQVDTIVRLMDVTPRRVLIQHYTQTGTGREKAIKLAMPKTTYFRWLDSGQWHVHIELEYSEVIA